MARILFLILICVVTATAATAQPLTFEEVVYPGDSTETKEELFNRAKSWFVEAFKDAQEVIQNEDKDAGVIIGKGSTDFSQSFYSGSGSTSGTIKFTVSIYVKEGRYKYVLSDFIHDAHGMTSQMGWYEYDFGLVTNASSYPKENHSRMATQKWSDKVWAEIKSTAKRKGRLIAESIKTHMANPTEMEEDDW